jgi:hypothetical protein
MRNFALGILLACATAPSSSTVVVVADQKPAAAAAIPEDSPCASDADCAFTLVGPAETACCPMLCAPRVVTKKRAKALEDRIPACSGGRECPQPLCRPPREQVMAACVQNKCVTKAMPAQQGN